MPGAIRKLAVVRARRSERGLTLVEILVAFAILFFVTLAILELFTMAYAVQRGAGVKTDLQYRAERAIEVIRWINRLGKQTNPVDLTSDAISGVRLSAQTGTSVDLPTSASDTRWAFWGPAGVGVVEANAPYILSYSVETGTSGYIVTVTARPAALGAAYVAKSAAFKAVRSAVQIRF